jgi:hypothetical protein
MEIYAELENLSFNQVENIISGLNIENPDSVKVLRILWAEKQLLPKLRIKGPISVEEYLNRWIDSYHKGFYNRPSQRKGKLSKVIPDSILIDIITSRYSISNIQADTIQKGHSILMSVENVVGEILEEYLEYKLMPLGWLCAWGSTIQSVDFCHPELGFLQIKNSDNSENSSSSSVRFGKPINKWFRRFSTRQNVYNWDALIEMTECKSLGEDDFREFTRKLITSNPDLIPNSLH